MKEGRGTRDGLHTEREFSSDNDKETRRLGDKEKIFRISDYGFWIFDFACPVRCRLPDNERFWYVLT